jgi:hypothetical protein
MNSNRTICLSRSIVSLRVCRDKCHLDLPSCSGYILFARQALKIWHRWVIKRLTSCCKSAGTIRSVPANLNGLNSVYVIWACSLHQLLRLSFVLVVTLKIVTEQFRSCIHFLLVPLLICGPHTNDEEGGNGLGVWVAGVLWTTLAYPFTREVMVEIQFHRLTREYTEKKHVCFEPLL